MARTVVRHTDRLPTNGDSARLDVTPRSVVSIAGPTKRKPSWVLLGSLLVGLAALLGAWVFAATSERMSIVVAGRDIEPGEVIDAGDLRVVEMGQSGEVRAILSGQQDLIIGRAARGPIPGGTVLNTDLFADGNQVIPVGMAVVGASLSPGASPVAGLRAGDLVDLLGVARVAGTPSTDAAPPTAVVLASGTVWSVERASTSSATANLWVAVLVPVDTQGAIAQAAADGLLRLTLVGAGE